MAGGPRGLAGVRYEATVADTSDDIQRTRGLRESARQARRLALQLTSDDERLKLERYATLLEEEASALEVSTGPPNL